MEKFKRPQLCWSCKRACGGECGCSWFNGFKPVAGWNAKNTIIRMTNPITREPEEIKSYNIIKCPLYERDSIPYGEKRPTNADKAKELGVSLRTYQRHLAKKRKAK